MQKHVSVVVAEKVKELRSIVENANKNVQQQSDSILSALVNQAVGFGYPNGEELHIFPIMPSSACVEFGRIRTAAHNPWVIYERDFNTKIFIKTISIK